MAAQAAAQATVEATVQAAAAMTVAQAERDEAVQAARDEAWRAVQAADTARAADLAAQDAELGAELRQLHDEQERVQLTCRRSFAACIRRRSCRRSNCSRRNRASRACGQSSEFDPRRAAAAGRTAWRSLMAWRRPHPRRHATSRLRMNS